MTGPRIRRVVSRVRRAAGAGPDRRTGAPVEGPQPIGDLVGGPSVRHDPTLDATPSVVVLLPHLSVAKMTGGPNTVLQITERLAARGIPVRYVACFGPLDADRAGLEAHFQDVTGIARPDEVIFEDRSASGARLAVGRDDLFVATWWPTAYVAERARALTRSAAFIYVIQDFEPGFHPWSTKYALAAATYRLPFRAIVNEPFLLEHLRQHGNLAIDAGDPGMAVAFMPAVDRTIFRPQPRPAGPRRLLFYARSNPRNLFELGLNALGSAVAQGAFDDGDWSFRSIGGESRTWSLAGPHVLSPMPRMAYRDYADLLAGSDLLLSLMLSPHSSYPPLEMATTGGRVVTNTFSTKTADALAAISPAIRAVEPDVESLVAALASAAKESSRSSQPSGPTTLPGSWDEALRPVMPWLETTIEGLRAR